MVPFFQGFGIGAGLIIAIGAQNSFVLSQGIKREHFILIPFICSLCDALLIVAGAAGIGTYISANPEFGRYAGIGGALFLFFYGLKALRSAFNNNYLHKEKAGTTTVKSVIFTTLALSLLNPHVYLDTVVLLGTISGTFQGGSRFSFTLGACIASFTWFFALSYGGSLLEPFFKKPIAWKILDIFIWLIMWIIGYSIWPR